MTTQGQLTPYRITLDSDCDASHTGSSMPLAYICAATVAFFALSAHTRGPAASHAAPAIMVTRAPSAQIAVFNVWVQSAAVLDETRIVLVGSVALPDESTVPSKVDPNGSDVLLDEPTSRSEPDPNGSIVNLATKTTRTFTNGHRMAMNSVAVSDGRILTTSDQREPILRMWDTKLDRPGDAIRFHKTTDEGHEHYAVSKFNSSNRIVVGGDDKIQAFDFASPDKRVTYTCQEKRDRYLYPKMAISRDDTLVAQCSFPNQELIYWHVATGESEAVPMPPQEMPKGELSSLHVVQFLKDNRVVLCRCRGHDEVPAELGEEKTDPTRRGVIIVKLPEGKIDSTGMGHTTRTMYCAVDPTETWIATVGFSRDDRTNAKGETRGELRVYNLKTRKLLFREQAGDMPMIWVAFTPSGKRLVTTTAQGVVRWWDVATK